MEARWDMARHGNPTRGEAWTRREEKEKEGKEEGMKGRKLGIMERVKARKREVSQAERTRPRPGMARRVLAMGMGVLVLALVMTFTPLALPQQEAQAYNVIYVNFSVRVTGWTVNVRSGPGTNYQIVRQIRPEATVYCDGWTYGTVVNDAWTGQPDARWYKIKGRNEWVASAVVYGNAPGSTPLPPSSPATREQKAVAWAKSQVGKSSFPQYGTGRYLPSKMYCAAFVASAYGKSYAGGNAIDLYNRARREGRLRGGTPAFGALVYYSSRTYPQYGHVAIYVGNNMVVEAGLSTIRMRNYLSWGDGAYLGWSAAFPDWPGR